MKGSAVDYEAAARLLRGLESSFYGAELNPQRAIGAALIAQNGLLEEQNRLLKRIAEAIEGRQGDHR